ncbi:hypothetical protein ANN_03704 [Periplaneta americana]|uniref:Uncharacterized protein n=1 Tax=Periplaneta americana TaxID=6978 RepID=A0ABQ8TZK1_PERAM|nr:hypothetical protein ANN_03704 [Periplaneta americana]
MVGNVAAVRAVPEDLRTTVVGIATTRLKLLHTSWDPVRTAKVSPAWSLLFLRSCNSTYCNEIETLAHVLGSCQHGELLRNSRHHNIRKLIAQALRNKSFEVHEEVHCVASEGGGIRRADIVALDKTNSKGFILDPTVRFEMSQTQPSEVNKEKQQIYEPTIPYFRENIRWKAPGKYMV